MKNVNSRVYKIFKATIFAAILIVLAGCNDYGQIGARVIAKEPAVRATWLTYWDLDDGAKDLGKIRRKLDSISYFGAYFDKNDRLFIPEELSDKKNELKTKGKFEVYLTFINDKQSLDGTVIMKDTEILRRIFADDASVERHIDEIIAMTLQGGYDGIEIDYERIWRDERLGQSFLMFANQLYVKAMKNNLKLRIVLEPSVPFAKAGFSNGPEYVVMLYNLHGVHNTPGPKANESFIQKTLAQMKALPGKKSVAFATGGCVWSSNGEKRFLTETEAKALAELYGSKLKRDKESQCVVFEYNIDDVSYQVWYADVKTLNYWISIAERQGENNISLWRLGGNIDINKIK